MTANRDIASLDLGSLFGELSKMAEGNRRTKAGDKRQQRARDKKPKVDIHAVVKPRNPFRVKENWIDRELVLLLTHITCRCCGQEYATPNSQLLVKRTNTVVGTHYLPPVTHQQYHDIPHTTEHLYQEVEACQLCHELGDTLYHEHHGPFQLSLPLEKQNA